MPREGRPKKKKACKPFNAHDGRETTHLAQKAQQQIVAEEREIVDGFEIECSSVQW
jgi:hypothetical protein